MAWKYNFPNWIYSEDHLRDPATGRHILLLEGIRNSLVIRTLHPAPASHLLRSRPFRCAVTFQNFPIHSHDGNHILPCQTCFGMPTRGNDPPGKVFNYCKQRISLKMSLLRFLTRVDGASSIYFSLNLASFVNSFCTSVVTKAPSIKAISYRRKTSRCPQGPFVGSLYRQCVRVKEAHEFPKIWARRD